MELNEMVMLAVKIRETSAVEEVWMGSHNQNDRWKPLKIAMVYAAAGVLWVVTDLWIDSLLTDHSTYLLIKWLLFIFLSGAGLYICIQWIDRRSHRLNHDRMTLLEKPKLLKALADHLQSGVLVVDPQRKSAPILYTNHRFTELTGYTLGEINSDHLEFLKNEGVEQEAIKQCEEAIRKRESKTVEFACPRKNGTSFWNEICIHPIFNQHGKLLFFLFIQNDISERKAAEQKLLKSEQYYKSLFEHNPELVCASNREGIITSVNPAVKNITGYAVKEVAEKKCWDFIKADNWEDTRRVLRKALDGEPQHVEFQVLHKEGHAVDLEASVMPIVIEGQIVGMYTIAKDVTKYKRAEEMLRKAEKLNVVGELAAGIAHEIRNPLTSLKGFVQLLRPSLTEKKAYTDVMLSELERIEQIVTELLLLAKPQAVKFEEKNLQELLEHVRTLLNTKAIMSNIEILLDYRCDTTKIYCEENQLKQVLINLLKNAIEAMPSGGKIQMEAGNTGEECVFIRVTDQGCGIPEESLPKLGEPFYTTKEQGTGLGLMISSKIIREHGGRMEFKSRENEGTTVEIYLPISPEVPNKQENKDYQLTSQH
ncbi:MAG TPA: PAS domain S-box protein [Bacillales bacterium]|nr:PAS domain S-box protein [Bacillales bacterium]